MFKLLFKNFVFIVITVLITGILLIPTTYAESVVRINDEVSITDSENIEGDFYPAAYKINISGKVENDVNAIGGQITINGDIGNDALLVAFKTDIHSTIGDDLRVVGYEVTIAEPVMGDVFIIGGTVNILSTASISGDLIIFGDKATVEGSIGGDVLGTINELRVDGQVAGDIDITVNQLTLGEKSAVTGNVHYVSNQLATQALNATIGGDLVRNDPVIPVKDVTVRSAIMPVLILLFSTLAWYLVSRRSLDLVVERTLSKSSRPLIIGITVFLFAPVAISILWVSVIGGIVGLVVVFGYVLLALLSVVSLAAVLGQLLMKVFNQPSPHLSPLNLIVGAVGVILLMLLPVIGLGILFGLTIITFGAMIDLLIRPKLK